MLLLPSVTVSLVLTTFYLNTDVSVRSFLLVSQHAVASHALLIP